MESILKNIEAIRKEKHIKQEVIAAELGIKQSSYSSYITRESDITFSRLSRNLYGFWWISPEKTYFQGEIYMIFGRFRPKSLDDSSFCCIFAWSIQEFIWKKLSEETLR